MQREKILGHNIARPDGRPLLRKGRPLTDEDLERLRALGRESVYVATLDPNDVDENTAARRVAESVCGPGLHISGVASGRANLLAGEMEILRVDGERLARINEQDGITLATVQSHFPVHSKQIVATVKIIPYAVPDSIVSAVETVAHDDGPVVRVDVLPSRPVGMVLSGSPAMQARLVSDFSPLRERIENLGSTMARTDFVAKVVAKRALMLAVERAQT
jgi:hypothetical protein